MEQETLAAADLEESPGLELADASDALLDPSLPDRVRASMRHSSRRARSFAILAPTSPASEVVHSPDTRNPNSAITAMEKSPGTPALMPAMPAICRVGRSGLRPFLPAASGCSLPVIAAIRAAAATPASGN